MSPPVDRWPVDYPATVGPVARVALLRKSVTVVGSSGGASAVTPATPSLAGEHDGQRSFTDSDGRHWRVTEELIPQADWTASADEGHRTGYAVGWLVFRCAGLRTRLRLFPVQWRTLSDEAQGRLCRHAHKV